MGATLRSTIARGEYGRLRIVDPHAKLVCLLLSSFVAVAVDATLTLTLG